MDSSLSSCVAIFSALLLHFTLSSQTTVLSPNSHNQTTRRGRSGAGVSNIILNPSFEDGLSNWTGKGCKIELHEFLANGRITPQSGKVFASAVERSANWNGIEQEITGRVQRYVTYEVTALVRIYGGNVSSSGVQITLWIQEADFREEYIAVGKSDVSDKDWVQLQGRFFLNDSPSRAIIFVEGPPPGTDILVNSLFVKPAGKTPHSAHPATKDPSLGVNIIKNVNLDDGTNGWFPLGNCSLSMGTGSPHELPPMARDSLGTQEYLSGLYMLVTNRSDTWMGPAQMITEKLKPYLTYQISAWVRINPAGMTPQIVNVALSVDNQWFNGGEIECADGEWHEIGGSFRIEKQPSNVMVYVQGPYAGVDLMVAGLQIFPVDRKARFGYLKMQIDKIRKRDVVLKFSPSGSNDSNAVSISIRQTHNGFPLGSCITRTSMDNEGFVKFLVENFNWVVFENEMKWSWTEPQEGKFNYKEADELLDLCKSYNLEVRGHCIFWEMEYAVQLWVRSLNSTGLMTAIQNRLTDLLTRYKGRFRHYDVNNEMLHGLFYSDRLGKDIRAHMFKAAHELDPFPSLFVNDYHIEDGSDIRSMPEKYVRQILDLQAQGAPVGGIGIQGHIDVPIGPIISSALDKLGTLGLPIWFTELDVSSPNEFIRADDLEVMLREAYAHPAVEGVMLWGFWELYMSREHAHLVNSDGKINTAGKRFLALKREWLSSASGTVNGLGEFRFRGFHGTYNVEIISSSKKVNTTFVVDRGESPLVLSIDI